MFSLISAMASTVTSDTGTTAAGGGLGSTLIMFAIIIAIFYFLIIRPQKKRDKEAKDMLSAIKKGDKVVTIGGIHGTVAVVKESTIIIKVDDNTRIEFSKNAISSVLNKKEEDAPAKKDKKKVEIVDKAAEEKVEEKTEEVAAPEATEEKAEN